MRGTIGLAARAFAAAALAALVVPAGCSPVQWDFVFVEEFPASDDPAPEFVIPIGGIAGGFSNTRDLDPQTGVEEGTELYLISLSFWITPGSTETDFSSFTSMEISVVPQSGGTPVVIADLTDPSLFLADRIDLVPRLVDLADYISVPYTVAVTVTGAGPTTELRFAGEATFSGTKAL